MDKLSPLSTVSTFLLEVRDILIVLWYSGIAG